MSTSSSSLIDIFSGCSLEATKLALSQSALNASQIKTILSSKGLQGELLKTTTDEIANIASTNVLSTSQKTATTTTIGFGNALKGLSVSLKSVVASHPVLIATAVTLAAIAASIKGVNEVQKWANGTKDIEKYNKTLEDSEQKVSNNDSKMKKYNDELQQNKTKLKELQDLQTNGEITDAQKTEIENLKYENALLDEKINKLTEANKEETKLQARTAERSFNTMFNDSSDDTKSTNAKDVINRVSEKYVSDNGDINWNRMLDGNDKTNNAEQLAKLKIATDAYNKAVENFNKEANDVNKENLDNAKEALDTLTSDFEKNREKMYNSLKADMEKMKAAEGTDAYNQFAYESMQSWLDIFKNYVPEYKEAMKKVQEEADKNPVEQKVTYATDFKTLNDSLSTLTENAELLSKVNKEISESGRISADNLKKINESFPEDKYPELTKSLYEYHLGLISTTELFDELEKCYNQDKNTYIATLAEKLKTDEKYVSILSSNYPKLFKQLQSLYGDDLRNWKTLEQAKADLSKQMLSQIGALYLEFFKAMGTTADQYAQKVTGLASGGGMANPMSKGYSVENVGKFAQNNADPNDSKLSALNSGIKQIKDTYDSMTKSLDDFMDKIKGDINVGDLDWGSLGGDLDSASSSAKDTSQEMNWLERAVKKVQNAYSRLKNVVSDTTRSWSTRNNALIQSQQELTRQINLQSQAYEYYMQLFNALDLDDYYKKLIMDGAILVETITDASLVHMAQLECLCLWGIMAVYQLMLCPLIISLKIMLSFLVKLLMVANYAYA